MLLLDEIIGWINGLRPWQQEAMRRIFVQPELTHDEIETILQMVREQEREGATAEGVQPFTLDDVPGASSSTTVQLLGISGLEQVNGFPSGRGFDLTPEGMTIFFGHNGAGKSGYARVFKNACKARHRVEVLPNAFGATTPPRTPSADFTILVDGIPETIRWIQNGSAHPHLSSVSVYDVACANDYIDAEGTPAFQPYGLTHLTRLVLLQRDLQARIGAERNTLILDTQQFEPLRGSTEVGRYIANLGGDSDRTVLARLATISEEELRRLEFLKQTLLESDPEPQALVLERLATRLEQALLRVKVAQRWIDDQAIAQVKELITTEKTANCAMQLALARLQGQDGMEASVMHSHASTLLEGTGAELWQMMYQAAETFSKQAAYPEHSFPHLESDAYCVLCQQPYSTDASKRMQRFAAFVADSATADAQTSALARKDALEKVQAVDLNVLDAPTLADVAERLPDLHAAITATASVWTARHTWTREALEAGNWSSESVLPPIEVNLENLFTTKATSLRVDANTLRTSADPAIRLVLAQELAELEARQCLNRQFSAVERFIQDSQAHATIEPLLFSPQPSSHITQTDDLGGDACNRGSGSVHKC